MKPAKVVEVAVVAVEIEVEKLVQVAKVIEVAVVAEETKVTMLMKRSESDSDFGQE